MYMSFSFPLKEGIQTDLKVFRSYLHIMKPLSLFLKTFLQTKSHFVDYTPIDVTLTNKEVDSGSSSGVVTPQL